MDPVWAQAVGVISGAVAAVLVAVASWIQAKARNERYHHEEDDDREDDEGG